MINVPNVACDWMQGKASVGKQKASLAAHVVAREFSDEIAVAVARSVGHAIATSHRANHSLGAAWYALKAVENAGKSVD